MLMRLMLAVCMMMGMLMPCAWAEEKIDTPSAQAMSTLTVEVNIYQKKGTHYIRYTFTNPTDEPIVKQIDHLEFDYDPHYADSTIYEERPTRFFRSVRQYSDAVTELSVSPHGTSSYSVPITLPLATDDPIFILPGSTSFYFADNSSLYVYNKSTPVPTPVYAYPVKHSDNNLYLCVYNISSQTEITEVKNIAIYSICPHHHPRCALVYHYFKAEPISLHLKANEQALLPLPSLNKIYKDCPYNPPTVYITINNANYSFDHHFDPTHCYGRMDQWSCDYQQDKIEEDTIGYYPLHLTASYEIDDSVLSVYCRVKNLQNKPFIFDASYFSFAFNYFNHNQLDSSMNSLSNDRHATLCSPYRTVLSPNEEEFFTFSFMLPPNFGKMRGCNIYVENNDLYKIYGSTYYFKKLYPLQKVLYTDLGKAVLDSPDLIDTPKNEW